MEHTEGQLKYMCEIVNVFTRRTILYREHASIGVVSCIWTLGTVVHASLIPFFVFSLSFSFAVSSASSGVSLDQRDHSAKGDQAARVWLPARLCLILYLLFVTGNTTSCVNYRRIIIKRI
jgi:hypothetical protein